MSDSTPEQVPGQGESGTGEALAPPIASEAVAAPPPLVVPEVAHPSEQTGSAPPPPAPTTYVAPEGYGAYTAPQATTASPARAALPWFLGGVAVAVGVSIAGWMVVHSRGGGVLWWGGYFVTFGLWRAAYGAYSRARAATGQKLGGAAMAVVVLGTVVALGSAAAFAVSYVGEKTAPAVADGVGSCWAEDGDQVVAVACTDSDAKYVAVSEVASDSDCATEDAGAIDSTTKGKVLCLRQR